MSTLTTPKEMGGDGTPGTNPEQLFAAGYSACFLGAMKAVSKSQNLRVPPDATVEGAVSFGPIASVSTSRSELKITLPASSAAPPKGWWQPPTRCARIPTPPAATWTSR